jgi:hypothetical protein
MLAVLPHMVGILWALSRRSALLLVLAILVQRICFIFFFVNVLSGIRADDPHVGPLVYMFLIIAIANTAMLLDVALVSAGLKQRMR